ncbi:MULTISPECIES: helix-turn-helix domain-containing protein [unclassified Rhizobium]|uniref:helix-turn-helix domain-containing protein n=1 Tax=unclassified Rhizobium TaxID=2613769 RepID=UPI0022ABE544|nr:helix-turn-helix transcriptional regulator [Rhizobium sp. AG207R]MCZ3378235.1 helix-turn-helix transcriptional regulator [Rhizobium sp. AG207R]
MRRPARSKYACPRRRRSSRPPRYLALEANVERAYVGYLERGNKNPTVTTLEKIAEALACDISEFFVPVADDVITMKPLKSGRKPSRG